MDYLNFFHFCERWQEKANNENPENGLNQCFDHFFSSFVIYNCVYNFCFALEYRTQGKNNDHQKAVQSMTSFAEKQAVISGILAQTKNDITIISDVLSMSCLYVYDKTKNGQKKEKELKNNLSLQELPENCNKRFEAVLELLYMVRCNMFHGEKDYIPQQQCLLKPLNRILDCLNSTILNVLRKKFNYVQNDA